MSFVGRVSVDVHENALPDDVEVKLLAFRLELKEKALRGRCIFGKAVVACNLPVWNEAFRAQGAICAFPLEGSAHQEAKKAVFTNNPPY